jgi:hypothetical protein
MATRAGMAALAMVVALGSGCIYMRDRTTQIRGYELSPSAQESLQKGVTTPADVEKMLGRPDQTITPAPGQQVLVYQFESNTVTHVSAFVVYRSASSLTHASTYRFEFKDGLLTGFTVKSSS